MTRSRFNRFHQTSALVCLTGAAGLWGCSNMSDARQPGEAAPVGEPSPAAADTAVPAVEGVARPALPEGGGAAARAEDVPTSPPGGGVSGASIGGGATGIEECDLYLSTMERCLDRMDHSTRAATESAFTQTRDAWKAAAALGGAAREAVHQGCVAAVAAMPPSCK